MANIVKIDDEITGADVGGDGAGRAGGKIVQISNSDSDEISNRILERTVTSWWNKSEFATRVNGVFVLCHVDGVIHAIVDLSNGNLGCCSFGIRGSAEPINSVYSNMLGALTFFSKPISRRLFSQMFSVWC